MNGKKQAMKITANLNMNELDSASAKIKVIAHPVRIKILQLLEDNEKQNVTQVYQKLKIPQAMASHELILLLKHYLIRKRRDGNCSYYSLNKEGMQKLISQMEGLNKIS
jgi:DNA-binding transcriptional ArsR family regulator